MEVEQTTHNETQIHLRRFTGLEYEIKPTWDGLYPN